MDKGRRSCTNNWNCQRKLTTKWNCESRMKTLRFILLNLVKGRESFTLYDSDNMDRDSKKCMGYI